MTFDKLTGRARSDVGQRLRLTRQALLLDQGEFGARAGLKPSAYNQYEMGKNMPSLEAAHSLCDTYHLTLEWIYRGDPEGLRKGLATTILALAASQESAGTMS